MTSSVSYHNRTVNYSGSQKTSA